MFLEKIAKIIVELLEDQTGEEMEYSLGEKEEEKQSA